MTLPSGTSITIGGVTCQELQGSGKVTFGPDGPVGERNFQCAWADRFELASELMGYLRTSPESSPSWFRTAPDKFVGYSGVLFCQGVAVNGVGEMSQNSDGYPTYSIARVDATYGVPKGEEQDQDDSDPEDSVVATLDIDFHSEFITFGSYNYFWQQTGTKCPEPIQRGKLVVVIDKTYQQKGLPEIPEAAIISYIGKVNSATWQGCEAGTMLFVGATSRKSYTAEGKKQYELTYHFKYRPAASWNKFWNPVGVTNGVKTGRWEFLAGIKDNGDVDDVLTVYDSVDFGAFFRDPTEPAT